MKKNTNMTDEQLIQQFHNGVKYDVWLANEAYNELIKRGYVIVEEDGQADRFEKKGRAA